MSDYEINVEIDVDDPSAIFAESKGAAAVSIDALEELGPTALRDLVAAVKAYVSTHPKLDVVYLWHRGGEGDELIIRWRWR